MSIKGARVIERQRAMEMTLEKANGMAGILVIEKIDSLW